MAACTRGAHGIPPARKTGMLPSASPNPRAPRNLTPVLRGREGGGEYSPAAFEQSLAVVIEAAAPTRLRSGTLWAGGIQSAKRVPPAMPPETAGTQRTDRDGVSGTQPLADTEGPQPETRSWVAVKGVSERSEGGRASDERPRTRLAKKGRQARTQKKPGPALNENHTDKTKLCALPALLAPTEGAGSAASQDQRAACYHPAMSRQIFGQPAGGGYRLASDAVARPVPCTVGPVEGAAR